MFKFLQLRTELFVFGCAAVNMNNIILSVIIDIWWCCTKIRSILVAVF